MQVIKFVLIFLEVLLLFNLLIAVHELGHFLAARWRGLKIDRFAVWFGKPIWKKKINGVEYALGSLPFRTRTLTDFTPERQRVDTGSRQDYFGYCSPLCLAEVSGRDLSDIPEKMM